ncbi:MAG TPA: hypothetical protein VGO35_02705 [Gammaproteobacteria bacterium]|nr:hypothetical protein [Gammaproteobacteria bacterium]
MSVFSLWVNSLPPFSPRVSHDAPTFALYKIPPSVSGDEKKRTWWIPSFDLGLSFYNAGRVAGEIRDIRIIADVHELRNTRKFYFYPTWLVDYPSFQRYHTERFKWLEKSVLRDWYSFIVGGQAKADIHLILEGGRWDNIFEGTMEIELQFASSKSVKWVSLARYRLIITEEMFSSKSCWTPSDKRVESLREFEGVAIDVTKNA